MKLEKAAALAEIVSSVAIVATLAYLALQTQQNTTALRAAVAQGLQDQVTEVSGILTGSDEFWSLMYRGNQTPSALTAEEMERFHTFWQMSLQAFQNMYFQTRDGVYDEARSDGWMQFLGEQSRMAGFRLHWERYRYILAPEFREYAETELFGAATQ